MFLQDISEQLDDEEENSAEMAEAKKKLEAEINDLKQDVDDLETALKKVRQPVYSLISKISKDAVLLQ